MTSQILGGKLNYTEGGVVEERVCKFHILWGNINKYCFDSRAKDNVSWRSEMEKIMYLTPSFCW